jgi:putative ABC transport system permease protein
MLKNYFKIAIAVLKRRKFFTFISLFGISFTLTILMVLTAFMDHILSPGYPDLKRDQNLYVQMLSQKNLKKGYSMNGPVSFYFTDHYLGSMKTPATIAVGSMFTATNAYVNNKKLTIDMQYTNGAYWQVYDFEFLEGKPYNEQQIKSAEKVAVITEGTRTKYFGQGQTVVGKFIEADNIQYRVIGVVKDVPITNLFAYANMYLPYTLSKADYRDKSINGNYFATIHPKSSDDREKVQNEYQKIIRSIPPQSKDYEVIESHADSYLAGFTRALFGSNTSSGIAMFMLVAGLIALLFMLLPTLNLMNINISRIMERSSEIGVRKAFGASSNTLVHQFIVENIILTFLGGAIGILLSFIIIQTINSSNLIENMHLSMNITVLTYSIVACLVFGLISGVYPAWRMSKLHVVNALKA